MNPIHIVTEKTNIASKVLLPGDPLRAKYIAENYLDDYKLINTVRNILGYTGYYKGKKVTVIASGMGCPSCLIYAYELYEFYNVKEIIRIGSAGALNPNVSVGDIVLGTYSYSFSNIRYALSKSKAKKVPSSNKLNQKILNKADKLNIDIKKGGIYTSEIFEPYIPTPHLTKQIPKNIKLLASEMESFALYSIANYLDKDATCLVTITDSEFEKDKTYSAEERQLNLNKMIYLALEAISK